MINKSKIKLWHFILIQYNSIWPLKVFFTSLFIDIVGEKSKLKIIGTALCKNIDIFWKKRELDRKNEVYTDVF